MSGDDRGPRESPDSQGNGWLLIPALFFGPSTWSGVAEALRVIGLDAAVAGPAACSTRTTDPIEDWCEVVVEAAEVLRGRRLRIAGHSAACPRLRFVAARLGDVGHEVDTIVYVEGRLPADGIAPSVADPQRGELMDSVTHPDGYLPPWFLWWGPLIDGLIPDEKMREQVWNECRRIPRSLFDLPIPAPGIPSDVTEAYLGFGSGYAPSLDVARAKGWPTAWLEGNHLHQVNDPITVASTLLALDATATLGGPPVP